jgi:hypothetical protein
MRKENAWLNGSKKIIGKTNEQKKTGWDVPMDETNAYPNLVKPSNYNETDELIAMGWKNVSAKTEAKAKGKAEAKAEAKEEAKAEAKA